MDSLKRNILYDTLLADFVLQRSMSTLTFVLHPLTPQAKDFLRQHHPNWNPEGDNLLTRNQCLDFIGSAIWASLKVQVHR